MTIREKQLAVIGCGALGGALVSGLLQQGHKPAKITATGRNLAKLQGLAEQGVAVTCDNKTAIAQADIIVLAVRPSQMASLLAELGEDINNRGVPVISVVAGLTLEVLATKLQVPLIRTMPNIASAIGQGVTIFQVRDSVAAAGSASIDLAALAEEIFAPLGLVMRAKSSAEVDSFTALCGCGPAYFFYFVDILCDYGLARGLPPAAVQQVAMQTIKGAAALMENTDKPPEELINQVAAPGEKTATRTGLDYMQAAGLAEIIQQGCAQAQARAAEMGREIAAAMMSAAAAAVAGGDGATEETAPNGTTATPMTAGDGGGASAADRTDATATTGMPD